MLAVPHPPNINVTTIKTFLIGWTAMPKYLRAVAAEGSVRYHADGSIQGPVSERDRLRARLRLQLAEEDTDLLGAVGGDRFVQHLVLRHTGFEEYVPPPEDPPDLPEAERYRIEHRTGRVWKEIQRDPPPPGPVDLNDGWTFEPTERLIKTRRKLKPEEVKRMLVRPPDED
jgi:hypothetical protein